MWQKSRKNLDRWEARLLEFSLSLSLFSSVCVCVCVVHMAEEKKNSTMFFFILSYEQPHRPIAQTLKQISIAHGYAHICFASFSGRTFFLKTHHWFSWLFSSKIRYFLVVHVDSIWIRSILILSESVGINLETFLKSSSNWNWFGWSLPLNLCICSWLASHLPESTAGYNFNPSYKPHLPATFGHPWNWFSVECLS